MIAFMISDMTCQHCVSTITQVVREIEPTAHVRVDLANRRVDIDGEALDAEALREAIAEAGYTVSVV